MNLSTKHPSILCIITMCLSVTLGMMQSSHAQTAPIPGAPPNTPIQVPQPKIVPAPNAPKTIPPAVVAPGKIGPRISSPSKSVDLGTHEAGAKVPAEWFIKNTGDDILKIASVKASCGCTTPDFVPIDLKPGEMTTIEAEFNSAGRSGKNSKSLTVNSNDPKTPRYTLTFKCNVSTAVALSSKSVNFGAIPVGETATDTVTITNNKDSLMTISSVKFTNNKVHSDLVETIPGKAWELRLRTDKWLGEGTLSDNATITYELDGKTATERVNLYGNVQGAIVVSPKNLPLVNNPSTPVDRQIYIRPGSVQQFNVLSSEWVGGPVQPTMTDLSPSGKVLALRGIVATPALNGTKIVIKTDVPGYETITVPVSVTGGARPAATPPIARPGGSAARPTVAPRPSITPSVPTPNAPPRPATLTPNRPEVQTAPRIITQPRPKPVVPAAPIVPAVPATPVVPAP